MKKLHVQQPDKTWKMVWGYSGDTGAILTTSRIKGALPEKQAYGKSDLEYFSNKYGNNKFALLEV